MGDKFQNKYRIPSARLQNWDYGSEGNYFITICTRGREHYFGEIITGMNLSGIGQLAFKYWEEIPKHFPFIELGNFVVMPNHVHGILIIHNHKCKNNDILQMDGAVETLHCNVSRRNERLQCNVSGSISKTLQCNVSTPPTDRAIREQMSKISPHSGSISTIVRSYKSIVARQSHFINPEFEWQTRFYDHIIRDAESFERIQNYIENNPTNWSKDKFYKCLSTKIPTREAGI